jgi:hypothetical protein
VILGVGRKFYKVKFGLMFTNERGFESCEEEFSVGTKTRKW